MYAASANKPDNVKILLAHNATTSLTDLYNLSAKDIADTKGFSVVIDIFLIVQFYTSNTL